MSEANYWLLLIPFCTSLAVLVITLLLREHQNAVIQKGLLDRLLVAQGHNPLPDIEPISDLTGESSKQEITEKIESAVRALRRSKQDQGRTKFTIPNMPQPRTGMGEVKR